ncbi:platelet-derived growth factor receptor alpha isoform X3 [Glossina fuscipes]|uniref:receptor protein-tyrosine kinase n=1 Tax=Glossina fuscipes TaxID=7396 RepID=A0A8U0WBE1_9MUSC|nr:platelet-derived growth factor receptor alpha isoform X3 [Glossina fuscipes]
MDLPSSILTAAYSRRSYCLHTLLLLGLWISNANIGCTGLPHPRPQLSNSISKGNDYDANVAVALGAPLLIPLMDELILEVNSDFTLKCEDSEPIIWKYPMEATVDEIQHKTEDKSRPFGSTLTLLDVNYVFVGNYYCIKAKSLTKDVQGMEDAELTDLSNSNLASSIYIYVNDTENFLAPMLFPVIHVMQFQDAVIPCKPSMPNVDVLLTTPTGKTLASDSPVRYNPRLGFVIELRNFQESGLYVCRPKIPPLTNEEESTEIELILGNQIIDNSSDYTQLDTSFSGDVDSSTVPSPTTPSPPAANSRTISTYTTHVDKPNVTSTAKHHAYEGDTFQLKCETKIAHDVRYKIEWIMPVGVDKNRTMEDGHNLLRQTGTHKYSQHSLTVKDAKKTDTGNYICNIIDHSNNQARNSYRMIIMEKGTSYINISEPNDYYVIREKANKTIQMTVRYSGYPWPTLTWYRPDGSEILPVPNQKFNITTTETSSTLKISNPRLLDSGTYVINATNGYTTRSQQFNVSISDIPIVSVDDVFVQADEKAHVTCQVQSHPISLITWVFTPCSIAPRWPSCDKKVIQDFNETSSRDGETPIEIIYDLYFVPKTPGIIHCKAENKIGSVIGRAHVLIRDIEANMTISGVTDEDVIARGDRVTITCAAVAYYFSDEINWFKEGIPVQQRSDLLITKFSSEYSYQTTLTFTNIQDSDRGAYECRARHINHDEVDYKFVDLFIHEPSAPRMKDTNLGGNIKIERKLGDSLELKCVSEAIPKATIDWYKDEIKITTNASNLSMDSLIIPYIRPEDEGQYKCVVSNRLGVIEEIVTVKITNMPGLKLGWIMGILLVLLVLICLVIYLCIRVNRERRLLRELKAAGLANFEEGAVEHINPALTLDEQADLLPYDRGFEFPREKLKLGKQLGAGAFGVVLKAHAESIRPEEKESVVAVKMVKRNANNEVMRALVSELKIMVHLGQHLNVVNLLGAVTKNIAKRELMVIVEYCRYGNVQNFLLRNRKRFINQINPATDKIDVTITTQRFSDNFELNRDGLRYANLPFSNHQYINHMNNINNMNNNYSINNRRNSDNDPRSGTRAGRPNSTGYITQSELYEGQLNTCATEQTVMTTVPEDDDNNIMSNNSVQPAWRSNYKPDSTEAMSITTTDLVSWAFQVACGMEYLSSKKVLHGDLAARNILLCEDNIVKICDFGLARSMYKSDNYKKQGEAPLPIKWLALESLSDHIFSTYTDVWSFGIVLWEFFSLAKVPYPGMDPNQSLYLKLKDGYRMEKPPYANDDLYDIMLECWSTNPERRPLFNVLKEKFASMLGEEVTNHYVDLNEPYLRVNSEYMKRNQTDYLALMGAPDEMAPPPPRYVNGHILPEIRIDLSSDDYLQMSPNNGSVIFSPTRPKETAVINDNDDDKLNRQPLMTTTSFTFPDTAAQQHSPTLANNLDDRSHLNKVRNKKDGVEPIPEEIPMLANANSQASPEQSTKFSQLLQQAHRNTPTPSPRHHVAETKLTADAENYVNLKSPKRLLNNNGSSKGPEAFSNPGYQILKTVAEKVDNN